MVAAENLYQWYMSEPATKLRMLFKTLFTNQCTKLDGYVNAISNTRDFILFPFLLLKTQP